jgi:2-polyprenyl-3-methyl-5-hydroxy-6-metoxy-1,4-benzoquinol methylase
MRSNIISKWKHFSYRLKSNKTKFTEIYNQKGFTGETYPSSGIGSSLKQTERIREQLPQLLIEYRIHTIVDAPCGDFTWMSKVNLDDFDYYGFDIVKNVIEQNQQQYAKKNINFDELDIVKQIPPTVDLILCRDCLVHLSNQDALKVLSNFKKSASKYLLTTTFINRDKNIDLVSGRGWRPINLQKQPYNLPHPLLLIDEECTEADGLYSDKVLGLWRIKDLT